MKKFLYTLAVAALALFTSVACTNDGGVTSFELAQLEVELDYEAGKASIPYTLESQESDVNVVFGEPSASWIHDLKADKAKGEITFKYDSNCFFTASTATREASFTVKCGNSEELTVTVSQAALQKDPFNLAWSNVTPTSCNFTCTPDDPTEFYLIQQVEKSTIESAIGKTWEEKVYAWAKIMVDADYESCVNGNFPTEAMLEKTPDINTAYKAEVEIYVYVIGCNLDGVPFPNAIGLYTPVFPVAPTLTLANDAVTVDCEASQGFMELTVENGGDFGSVVVRSSETWLTVQHNQESKMVEFTASRNNYNRTRSARVDVSYENEKGDVFATTSFAVFQEPDTTAEKYTFELKAVETHWNGVVLSVVPSNKSVKYIVGAIQYNSLVGTYSEDFNALASGVLHSQNKIVLSGDQARISIPINTNYYSLENWYFYVYSINDEESEPSSDVTTIFVEKLKNDKPELAWADGEEVRVPAAGGTLVLGYKFVSEDDPEGLTTTIVEGGAVRLNTYPVGGPIDDQWGLLKRNPPVVDEVNRTVTLEINEYDTSKDYHWVRVGIVYYNKLTDESYGATSIKIVQEGPAQ